MANLRLTNAKPGNGIPHFERITQIVMDHVFYAERNPEKLKETAVRLGTSTQAALALAIADQINEEFSLVLRTD